MEITIGFWVIPVIISAVIWIWIHKTFPYSGGMDFTPLFSIPLGAFLTAITWMIYFATMYFTK